MPRFRVNNLSISLSDKFGDQVLIPTPDDWHICNWPFTCHQFVSKCYHWPSCGWFSGCGWWYSIIDCPGRTVVACPGPSVLIEEPEGQLINPVAEADMLDQMREQLEAALKEVERRGLVLEQHTKPRTREQAAAMEQQLTQALEELKRASRDLE
ncbi:MAG: hypothetical protein ACK2UK_08020 [Candidatus Promineifilaceae bacterium]